ncbi:MAG: EF-P beta-lysylation protein EpmB [Chromatiales bacterium]|nr:EF-P beta-lysylation protein EpmB [Chromatiales bacterium]
MIHRTELAWQTPNWQQSLANAISSLDQLCKYLELAPSQLPFSADANRQFPLRVPYNYASLIEKRNPRDPLLLQILPDIQELNKEPGFITDPVGDLTHHPAPGIIHKYHGRALIITTGACAIHCRYCFRRHFPYADSGIKRTEWEKTLAYLESHQEIDEIILSGGDPLVMSDQTLTEMIDQLAGIAHLQRIRIHTRVPTVLPERITGSPLMEHLANNRLTPIVVLHINHPNELSPSVTEALKEITKNHIFLLNQSVLLKTVNDSPSLLTLLSEKLFQAGVLPYYLHLLDKVEGAAHFAVQKEEAIALHQAMMESLPGYMVPKLVMEQDGADSKLPVTV